LTDTGNITSSALISGQTGSFSGNNSSQIVNVAQSGGGNAISGSSTSGVGLSGTGIYGVEGQTTTAYAPAVLGVASGANGEGVFGQETATTGNSYGVYGQTASPAGAGVEGYATSSPGIGVLGTAPDGQGIGIEGTANGAAGIGVYGQTSDTQGIGVVGGQTATSGTNYGVYGYATSGTGNGVFGYAANTTGSNIGVNGVSGSGTGTGVLGQAPGLNLSGTAASRAGASPFGVAGDTTANNTFASGIRGTADDAIGVLAENNGTNYPTLQVINNTATFNKGGEVFFAWMPHVLGGVFTVIGDPGCASGFMGLQLGGEGFMENCTNYTLLGDNSGNTYLNAVGGADLHFRIGNVEQMTMVPGEVFVDGTLYVDQNLSVVGNKNFRIDDPLDPANKYLFHASIESSEVLNLYSGNAILDGSGEAIIQLPDWFEVINKDFRYQLTAIGAPGRDLYIAEEVSGGHFKVAGGKPGGKVSWQVSGVRNDAWEKAHPMVVEANKGANRGHYLTPEFYGAPETLRIGYIAPISSSELVIDHSVEIPERSNTSESQRKPPRVPIPPRQAPAKAAPPLHPVSPATQGNKSQLNQR
jgi:trimeric autotransporter adhesin